MIKVFETKDACRTHAEPSAAVASVLKDSKLELQTCSLQECLRLLLLLLLLLTC
jgi:hypothetical protein